MSNTRLSLAVGLSLLLAGALPALAQNAEIARVKSVSGQATVVRGADRLPAKPGDPLYLSDVITTGADGALDIAFVDNTEFKLTAGGELALKEYRFDRATSTGAMLADIKHGTLSVVSGAMVKGSPGAMKIKTPTAVLNVRGTTFLVKID